MKRISFLAILIFITGIMFSCSDSSSSNTEEGYIDPGLTAKDISNLKRYTFTADSCGPSNACGAVIYSGELNKTDYVGIAADNRDTNNPPTFKFKMYWQASSIPTGTNLTLPSCTIIINNNSVTGANVTNVDITNNLDGTYTITFNNPVAVGGTSIVAGNNLRAYAY